MTFRYRRYSILGNGGRREDLYRPDIEIRVVGAASTVALYGLLDTGADMVLLPQAVAEVLGVSLDRTLAGRVRGFASGAVDVLHGDVTLAVGGEKRQLHWTARVGFLAAWPGGQGVVILGRTGFLEYFDVLFRGDKHEVVLTPNASFPRPR